MQENYYEEQVIKDQKYQNITKEQSRFIDCTFENCLFEDCIIIGCVFVNCKFYKCNIISLKSSGVRIFPVNVLYPLKFFVKS